MKKEQKVTLKNPDPNGKDLTVPVKQARKMLNYPYPAGAARWTLAEGESLPETETAQTKKDAVKSDRNKGKASKA